MTGLIPLALLVIVWALGVLNHNTVVEIRRRPTPRGERRGKEHA